MKILQTLSFLLLISFGCTKKSEEIAIVQGASQQYSTPVFSDPQAFTRLRDAFSVVDKIYKTQMEKNHYPGIAYGVIANGELVHSGSFGFANLEDKTSATTHSLFRIASMSKSLTAMAIMKLRDEGKLSLQDPVSKFIPEMSKVGSTTTDASAINIQHLLTMSAGFPEDNPWGDRQLDDTDDELIQLISQGISFSNAPGIAYEYSNLGFALLGKIITNITTVPYQQYITENIMKPLGMKDAKWEFDEVPKEKLAHGYRWEDEQWKEEALLHDRSYGAMGGLICSIEDFSKYMILHLSAWPPRNEEDNGPIKRSSIREMHQPWRVNNLFTDSKNRNGEICPQVAGYGYGLGWRKDCVGTVRVSHSGGLPGFGSEWRIYPDYGIGVVSFSNRTYGAPSQANAIALDTLIQLAGLKPRTLPASLILNQRKEEIVDVIQNWKEDQLKIFAENFFLDLTLEKWKANTSKLFSEAGSVMKISEVNPSNQLRGSFTIVCEKKSIEVFFTLTPERNPLIQQLDVWIK